jgi:hypothetical protein
MITMRLATAFAFAGGFGMAVDPPPPTWPSAFSGSFVESITMIPNATNEGRWFYDYNNFRSRFEHGDGQHNNFCACADNTTTSACHLYFPSDGTLWAHFPRLSKCCRVCEEGQDCTTLKPDWLAGATFVGEEQHGSLDCLAWQKPGAVALDVWSQTREGRACQYREHFPFGPPGGVWHFLNFTNFSTTLPTDPGIFELPQQCQESCPRIFGKTCG